MAGVVSRKGTLLGTDAVELAVVSLTSYLMSFFARPPG